MTRRFRFDRPPRPRPPTLDLIVDLATTERRAKEAWARGEALAASGDIAGALPWIERAHRIAPGDRNLHFALAAARLRSGQAEAARDAFATLAELHGGPEVLAGLVASFRALGDAAGAHAALGRLLASAACTPVIAGLARSVIGPGGAPGWCGLTWNGEVRGTAEAEWQLDDVPIPTPEHETHPPLPAGWETARLLSASRDGQALIGSPIRIAAILRLEGVAERTADGVTGWAWHPAAPDEDPWVYLLAEDGRILSEQRAVSRDVVVDGATPLAQPRGFRFDWRGEGPVSVVDRAGVHLLGSPVSTPRPDAVPYLDPGPTDTDEVAVVIPVYAGFETTLACLRTVIDTVPPGTEICVVDDASPDRALRAALADLATAGAITLLSSTRNGRNVGFPGAANTGLRWCAGRDTILLNSDTLVAPGWLETLRDAARSAPDIASATPFGNDATIFGYPDPARANAVPDLAETRRLASLAARVNAGRLVEVPTPHGFCAYLRAPALAKIGLLRADLFAQGYGEENDWGERARAAGFRHIAVPSVFVAHVGGVSFGPAKRHLLRRNLALLHELHPAYHERIAAFVRADGLRPARARLDAARWRLGRARAGAVLLITHGNGGGTDRVVRTRMEAARAGGLRPIVLRAAKGLAELSDDGPPTPNLLFDLPRDLAALARLLRGDRVRAVEVHHLLGLDHSVMRLPRLLGAPYDMWVHDWAAICPRLSLVTGEARHCGEPPATVCRACIARWGQALDEEIDPAALRARSAADFAAAQRVVVATEDAARRIARHMPGATLDVRPWEEDAAEHAAASSFGNPLHVAVVGAIGPEKGYSLLLDCARDAVARDLPIRFTIIGYSVDDAALEATGKVFVTGEFKPREATALIHAQRADFAFFPAIWPETWCYALSDAWAAGLEAAVFDIGAPAERVRRTGRGWVLPLGLPASRVNDALLRLTPARPPSVARRGRQGQKVRPAGIEVT